MVFQRVKLVALVVVLLLQWEGALYSQNAMFHNQYTMYNPALAGKFNTLRVSSLYRQPTMTRQNNPAYSIYGNAEYNADAINSGFAVNYLLNQSIYSQFNFLELVYAYHHEMDEEWSIGAGVSVDYRESKINNEIVSNITAFPPYGDRYNQAVAMSFGVYGSYNDFTLGMGLRQVFAHQIDTFNTAIVTRPTIQTRYMLSVGERWLFSTNNNLYFNSSNVLVQTNLVGSRNGNFWTLVGYNNLGWGYRNVMSAGFGFAPWKKMEFGYIQRLNFNSGKLWQWGGFELTLSYRIPKINRENVTCGVCIEQKKD
jgi:hypothetical protein